LGKSTLFDRTTGLTVPENASIVAVDPSLECGHSKAFILGGVDYNGNLLNWAMGIDFISEKENGVNMVKAYMSFSDDELILPNFRMMH